MTTTCEPLFQSAHAALVYAFNYSGQAYDRPIMNRMADDPVEAVSKGLSGLDGAGQAGMIFNKLQHLPPLYQYIVFATYAPRSIPCSCRYPCCSGHKRNEFWHACIRQIEEAAITQALPGCVSHRVLRRGIIQREFGDKSLSLAELAEKAGVHRDTATNHASKIRAWLHGQKAKSGHEAVAGVKTAALRMIAQILAEDGLVSP
ncbi:DNA-binding protein [Paracandidimonas lactea]|uniref:DNA-binding protein n=1 Tax=Paracandidimonas lactea TaxID=2895524 RepID=UPI001F16659E|nr:DNA-binding protein [Paracandidimonas lactea]